MANWETKGETAVISTDLQAVLDTALDRADQGIQQWFAAFLASDHATPSPGKYGRSPAAEDSLFPSTLSDYREFMRSAYVTREPGMDDLIGIREVSGLGSHIRTADAKPHARAELAYRIKTLREHDTSAPWNSPSRS